MVIFPIFINTVGASIHRFSSIKYIILFQVIILITWTTLTSKQLKIIYYLTHMQVSDRNAISVKTSPSYKSVSSS